MHPPWFKTRVEERACTPATSPSGRWLSLGPSRPRSPLLTPLFSCTLPGNALTVGARAGALVGQGPPQWDPAASHQCWGRCPRGIPGGKGGCQGTPCPGHLRSRNVAPRGLWGPSPPASSSVGAGVSPPQPRGQVRSDMASAGGSQPLSPTCDPQPGCPRGHAGAPFLPPVLQALTRLQLLPLEPAHPHPPPPRPPQRPLQRPGQRWGQ